MKIYRCFSYFSAWEPLEFLEVFVVQFHRNLPPEEPSCNSCQHSHTHCSSIDFNPAIPRWGQGVPQKYLYGGWDVGSQLLETVSIPSEQNSMTLDWKNSSRNMTSVKISVILIVRPTRNIGVCFSIEFHR